MRAAEEGGLPARLLAAAATLSGDRVALTELAAAHGHATQGSLLVLLAAPCVLPVAGLGTVLGVGLAALAWAMWRGHEHAPLPPRVATLQIARPAAERVLRTLASLYGHAGRVARQRMQRLAPGGRRSAAAAMAVSMAGLIVLPIPLGNLLPALSLMLLGLSLIYRDGLAMLLSVVFAVAAWAWTLALGMAAWHWGAGWVLAQMPL